MLAVIYKAKIIQGKESCYVDCWRELSAYLQRYRGAIGSCIHHDPYSGLWIIYSRWPDLETKEKSWPLDGEKDLPKDILKTSELMISCVEEMHEPLFLDVIEDQLLLKQK